MTTQEKIEKLGYKVTRNIGYHNGEQCVVSVTASSGNLKFTRPTITQLFEAIQKKR